MCVCCTKEYLEKRNFSLDYYYYYKIKTNERVKECDRMGSMKKFVEMYVYLIYLQLSQSKPPTQVAFSPLQSNHSNFIVRSKPESVFWNISTNSHALVVCESINEPLDRTKPISILNAENFGN